MFTDRIAAVRLLLFVALAGGLGFQTCRAGVSRGQVSKESEALAGGRAASAQPVVPRPPLAAVPYGATLAGKEFDSLLTGGTAKAAERDTLSAALLSEIGQKSTLSVSFSAMAAGKQLDAHAIPVLPASSSGLTLLAAFAVVGFVRGQLRRMPRVAESRVRRWERR